MSSLDPVTFAELYRQMKATEPTSVIRETKGMTYMTTGVRGCENQSNATVSFVNVEHPADSAIVPPSSYTEMYAWISQHRNRPLSVQTKKGTCYIWDQDWEIRGQWEGNSSYVTLAIVKHSPQDYKMTVDNEGDISLALT
jgi:hypothetical protein